MAKAKTIRTIAIAAAVGGGGLLAFAALRRVRFKSVQATAPVQQMESSAVYQSTAPTPSAAATKPTVSPKGQGWMIHPATLKLAPQLFLAQGLQKTVSLGKSGLITALAANRAMEFAPPSVSAPGLLGSLVTWGFTVQSWLFEHMKKNLQFTWWDRSRDRISCVMYKNRGAGDPKPVFFPIYKQLDGYLTKDHRMAGWDRLPLVDFVVGWPFFGSIGGPGINGDSRVVDSRTSVFTPNFNRPVPTRSGYEKAWMRRNYWSNYGFINDKCHMGQGDFVWRESFLGESFQVHKYPWQENMDNLGEIKPGGRHPRADSYKSIHAIGGSSIPSLGVAGTYHHCSEWLVWAAEWYRLSRPFETLWPTGKLPKYKQAPSWWRDHCLSWGIGVPDKWRWENLHHPAWDGIVPLPGMWSGDTESLLRLVVKWTPRPGSMFDSGTKRDVATDWVDRFPGVDWPTETGTMWPFNGLPYGYWEDVKKALKEEVDAQAERCKMLIGLVPGLVKTMTGDATYVQKAVDIVEAGFKIAQAYGISVGPIMPLFGVARVFTSQDMSKNLFTANPAEYITRAIDYVDIDNLRVEEQLSLLQEKARSIEKGLYDATDGKWIRNPWPHMSSLIGSFQDLPQSLRKKYKLLYEM